MVPLRNTDGSVIVPRRVVTRARSVAEALFLTEQGPPPADRLDWLELEVEDFLARAGTRSRFIVSLALFAVVFLAPLLSGRLISFSRLGVEERANALARLEDTFGAPVLAVKAMLCVIYYEHPDAARFVGFDGECLKSSEQPRLPMAT
jgi:hypothetical protein